MLVIALTLFAGSAPAQDVLDRLGEALTFNTTNGALRARVSGLLDLEAYYSPDTRSDLRFADDDLLVHPRLSLFLDAELGERAYLFAQTRLDRGFDPAAASARLRLDELALRFAVLPDGALHLQAGKFATVFGAWTPRHHSWDNPFVTAPLVFENLTAIWDRSVTTSVAHLLRRAHVEPLSGNAALAADKDRRLPVIWGPSYTSGAAVLGRVRQFDYAVEFKNAALSSRPENWDLDDAPWGGATVSGRIGWRPDESWNLGLSASRGTYLSRTAIPTVMPGTGPGEHRQTLIGADLAYAHRHLQLWTEAYLARFAIPGLGEVRTTGYYVEAKYKFAPQLFGAVRWNQQMYSRVTTDDARRVRWGRDAWRVDFAIIHRVSAQVQVKFQYSPQHESPAPPSLSLTHAFAAQLTARF
jgi:hypothetical protein